MILIASKSKWRCPSFDPYLRLINSTRWDSFHQRSQSHTCSVGEQTAPRLTPNRSHSAIDCVEITSWMETLSSCHAVSSQRQGGICGPWIPDDGKIVTHTVSKAGKMTQKYWTSKVTLTLKPMLMSSTWVKTYNVTVGKTIYLKWHILSKSLHWCVKMQLDCTSVSNKEATECNDEAYFQWDPHGPSICFCSGVVLLRWCWSMWASPQ